MNLDTLSAVLIATYPDLHIPSCELLLILAFIGVALTPNGVVMSERPCLPDLKCHVGC